MEDFRHAQYRNILIEVADLVDQDSYALESMKFKCSHIIKGREREKIKSAIQLWTALEKRELLGPLNITFLKDILKSCMRGQVEALNIVENYERLNGNAPDGFAQLQRGNRNSQPTNPQIIYIQNGKHGLTRQQQERKVLGPDLKNEIAYLTKSLGRNWEFLMRELGIPQCEIEVVTMDYRYTREQIHQCFLLWQDMEKQQATKEKLVHALRAVERNDLADNMEEGVY